MSVVLKETGTICSFSQNSERTVSVSCYFLHCGSFLVPSTFLSASSIFVTDLQTFKPMYHHKVWSQLPSSWQALEISHSTSIFWLHFNEKSDCQKRKKCGVMIVKGRLLEFHAFLLCKSGVAMMFLPSDVSRTSLALGKQRHNDNTVFS